MRELTPRAERGRRNARRAHPSIDFATSPSDKLGPCRRSRSEWTMVAEIFSPRGPRAYYLGHSSSAATLNSPTPLWLRFFTIDRLAGLLLREGSVPGSSNRIVFFECVGPAFQGAADARWQMTRRVIIYHRLRSAIRNCQISGLVGD